VTVTERHRARLDQDQVRAAGVGEARVIAAGRVEAVRVLKTNIDANTRAKARELVAGIARPRPLAPIGTLHHRWTGRAVASRGARSAASASSRRRPPGRLLPGLTRRRRPRSGATGPQGRAVKPASRPPRGERGAAARSDGRGRADFGEGVAPWPASQSGEWPRSAVNAQDPAPEGVPDAY
jgi:hypothetical protein